MGDPATSGGAKRTVTQAIQLANDCRAATEALRDLAYRKVQSGELRVEDFNTIDDQCGQAVGAAAKLLTKAMTGLSPALENNLDQLVAGTASLEQSIEKLQHAKDAVALAGSLLTTVLTIAAAVIDPTHTTVIAAVSSLGKTAQLIASQVQAGKPDADDAGKPG